MSDDHAASGDSLPVSALHEFLAEAHGHALRTYPSVEAAHADPDAVVVLSGDDGGTIYLTVPFSLVRCDLDTLSRLALDLDLIVWDSNDPTSVEVSIEPLPVGSAVAGGMGGGVITTDVWTHPDEFTPEIHNRARAVITGERSTLNDSNTSPTNP